MTNRNRTDGRNQSPPLVKLGAVVDERCFQNGIYKHADAYGAGIPIVRINDFNNLGGVTTRELNRVTVSSEEHRQFVLSNGDILINRVNSLSHVGKSMLVPSMDEYPVFESNMMRIRIDESSALSPAYVAAVLQSEGARNHFRKVAKRAVAQTSINQDDVRAVELVLYPKPVQQRIADMLFAWDVATKTTDQLIAAKQRSYAHELSRLINNRQNPQRRLATFADEVSTRNRQGDAARVLSVTNSSGFALPEDQFQRRVASSDLSNYKVVLRGQYAYNPSRINVGSIARLDTWEDGVLSPMYVVFRLDEAEVNSDYFLHWLSSHEARQRINNSSQGSVRETVAFSEFSALSVPVPDIERQLATARYLDALQDEIKKLQDFTLALTKQKRALLTGLLNGSWQPAAETSGSI